MLKYLLFLNMLVFFCGCKETSKQYSYPNWKLHYPENSMLGLFLAVAIPLDLPRNSAYLAFNWEANYRLPNNISDFNYPPIIEKRIDRKLIYNALEYKLKTKGYSGQGCLLRVICETAANGLAKSNGVLGDILHIFLTPSTTQNKELQKIYEEAEILGKQNKDNCYKYYNKNCSISLLDLITWLDYEM